MNQFLNCFAAKTVFIIFLFANTSTLKAFSENKIQHGVVHELVVRNGLPNFFTKIQSGDSIRVAYLGGSITAQPGWRVYSLNWMKKRFTNVKFSEINAAIGGTGSDFGVFRLNDHVLQFKPDLVFVEFAVNDGGTASEKIIRSMEGIVRQIWQQDSKTDICFVYTLKEDFLKMEQEGNLPNSAQTMEKVADHYGIPSINFGHEVASQVSKGTLIFTNKEKELDGIRVFCPDGVHPYVETGHQIYNEVLTRSFEAMIPVKITKGLKHKTGKPIVADYFANTKLIDFTSAELSKNWEIIPVNGSSSFSSFSKFLTKVGKATQTGETLTVRFKGKAIGIYDIMGPDAGRLIVEIDGAVKDTIMRFDKYCTYRRMNYHLIDKLEDKDHVVVFKVLADPFDKKSILSLRGNVMNDPTDFKENNWYIGKILLDGELK